MHVYTTGEREPGLDAIRRRRQMSRRRAARRVKNIGAASFLIGALAVYYAPSPEVEESSPSQTSLVQVRQASLPMPSPFKPAGHVLQRNKHSASPALPFAADQREVERRESLARWNRVYTYATRYKIKPELAGKIYDAAVNAGVEPELGFRLIKVESEFNPLATSPVGAVGLMQLMPATARYFEPQATTEHLYDVDTNLRIGFQYLRGLIRERNGNVALALLVYNRGPVAVNRALAMGQNPTNGYDLRVMRGYTGNGVID